jgi:hypothetical protein
MGRAAPEGGEDGESGAPGGQQGGRGSKTKWTDVARLYDPYHSALDIQVVADLNRADLCLRLNPVYAGKAGPVSDAGERKYNYDENVLLVMSLQEVLEFRHRLGAFMNGALAEVVQVREGVAKQLVLARAESYFPDDAAALALHAGGLVLSIEQFAEAKGGERTVVFISRPKEILLSDDPAAEPIVFHPEFEAILAVLDSYVGNVARVDFASCRLLDGRAGSAQAPTGGSAPQPIRRSAGGAPQRGLAAAAQGGQAAGATDTDIESALGSPGGAAAGDDMERVLGGGGAGVAPTRPF